MIIKVSIENLVDADGVIANSSWSNLRGLKFISLEEDIKINGVKFPLRVISLGEGKYKIRDGRHRFLYAKRYGIKELECDVIG